MPTYKMGVSGMHCANCANNIGKMLKDTPGVRSAEVSFATEKAEIDFDEGKTSLKDLNKIIEKLGYRLDIPSEKDQKNERQEKKIKELKAEKAKSLPAFFLAIIAFAWVLWVITDKFFALPMPNTGIINSIAMIAATFVLFNSGRQFLGGVWHFIRYGQANMDTLIGIGTGVAWAYSCLIILFPGFKKAIGASDMVYFDATIVIIGFVSFGKYLERKSKLKTGEAVEKLLHLSAKTAIVMIDGQEVERPINEVAVGDIIIVKPGAKVPVDGEIIEGRSSIDESMISGEPLPADKNPGDYVLAGTINKSGWFKFQATKVGQETMLAQIIKTVEDAQSSKAPIENLADRVSAVFVPAVMSIAVLSVILWLTIGTGSLGFSQALSYAIMSLVAVLTVACPCALGLATPTAIIVGVGKGASLGLLIKDAESLEKLESVDTVAFDKTGTLTEGKPQVQSFECFEGFDEKNLLTLAAAIESKSEHPLAKAIVDHTNDSSNNKVVENFQAIEGFGVEASIDGQKIVIRKAKNDENINNLEALYDKGQTAVIIEIDGHAAGLFGISDTIKKSSKAAIDELRAMGIKVVMITGDNSRSAQAVAENLGIDETISQVRPNEKYEVIKKLQEKGNKVAFAGDGINDAPALAQATVGLSMATGSDIAIEASGIAILSGDIAKVPKAIKLAKATMRTIKQNLFWAFIYNTVAIPVAAGILYPIWGIFLNPVFTGIAMAFSSVSVVGNSLRLKAKNIK